MKKYMVFLILILFLFASLAACNEGANQESQGGTIGNPTPGDFLLHADADIFLLGEIVYSNAQGIEWVQELNYKIGEQIGEITKKTNDASGFENGTSNILPVGTKIYETDTPAYIAIVNGKKIPYLKMIEG